MNRLQQQRPTHIYYLGLAILIFFTIWQDSSAANPPKFSSQRASFAVLFRDELTPYRVTGVFVLPNEVLCLSVTDSLNHRAYEFHMAAGKLLRTTGNCWQWQAPDKHGLYPLKILRRTDPDSIHLNVFVMIPFDQLRGEYLNHYRVGTYPAKPLKGKPIYQPPRGFIEVTKELEQTPISPHFKLHQFLCKQECQDPKYIVLEERLILKLELILEKVNEQGYRCSTFHIMSGYRTPHYNQAIGNVTYSRHCWGAAADIFIDENPKDGIMDDLNGDGEIDLRDARLLQKIIDKIHDRSEYRHFLGGLASYKANASHGPFVHVDVRGYCATWGE